jgi:hypothetical protein
MLNSIEVRPKKNAFPRTFGSYHDNIRGLHDFFAHIHKFLLFFFLFPVTVSGVESKFSNNLLYMQSLVIWNYKSITNFDFYFS